MANQPITLPKNGSQTEVGRPEVTRGVWYTPRVDVLETDEELALFADLPGTRSEDVDFRFENGRNSARSKTHNMAPFSAKTQSICSS